MRKATIIDVMEALAHGCVRQEETRLTMPSPGLLHDRYVSDRFSVTFASDDRDETSDLVRVIINPFDAKARIAIDNAAAIEALECEAFTRVRLLRDGLTLFDSVGEPYSADVITYSRHAAIDLSALTAGRHNMTAATLASAARGIAALYRRLSMLGVGVNELALLFTEKGEVFADSRRSTVSPTGETDTRPLMRFAEAFGISGDTDSVTKALEAADETMFGGSRGATDCHCDRSRYEILCDDAPENRYPVRDNTTGLIGYCDDKGKLAIEAVYDEVGVFDEGLAVVIRGGKSGMIDRFGNGHMRFDYDYLDYDSVTMTVIAANDGIYRLLTRDGEPLGTGRYGMIGTFRCGRAPVTSPDGTRHGYIDTEGREAIALVYDSASPFTNNIAEVTRDGRRFNIDIEGNIVQ